MWNEMHNSACKVAGLVFLEPYQTKVYAKQTNDGGKLIMAQKNRSSGHQSLTQKPGSAAQAPLLMRLTAPSRAGLDYVRISHPPGWWLGHKALLKRLLVWGCPFFGSSVSKVRASQGHKGDLGTNKYTMLLGPLLQ